ncbi:MAG: ribonuclease HII [Candidatus Sumerlaeaceae bacterium]|nr:ribonuclease HII [Candidatus Sumerlaeaceae bacterium]
MTQQVRKRRETHRKESIDLYDIEEGLRANGYARVAGLDEAGRGPLAGPVCAAAVIFPQGTRIDGVNDSKQLTHEQREELFVQIQEAGKVGVGLAFPEEIDAVNILNATKLACHRALQSLPILPDYLLLDALTLGNCTIPQEGLVKGDARCFSIAAASIVAKVTRDRLMTRYAEEFPQYEFGRHKGYPTEFHYARIEEHGLSTIHRRSFFDPGFLQDTKVFSVSFLSIHEALRRATGEAEIREGIRLAREATGFLPRREIEELTRVAREALLHYE